MIIAVVLLLTVAVGATVVHAQSNNGALPPVPSVEDEPVMAGYDLVAYHSLQAREDGVPGNPAISHRHSNGYLYYFASEQNRQAFVNDPAKYLPQYGGFCAWGMVSCYFICIMRDHRFSF